MTRMRLLLVGLPAAAVFLLCCAITRGGLFDNHPYGDVHLYGHYAREMTSGHWPYRDFFDEYPPVAQPLFLAVRLLPGSFVPGFKWTMAVFGAAAVVLLVLAIGGSLYRVVVAAGVAAVSPLLVGPVFLNTYDLFPAFLTALALLAWLRGRERATYVLLALGVGAKIYPIVLLPLVLADWGRVRRALAWFGGVLALVHLPFAIAGPGGLRFSYWVQLRRGLEVESLGGSLLLVLDRLGLHRVALRDEAPGSRDAVGSLADAIAALSTVALVATVLTIGWLYLRRRRDRLVAASAAISAFVAFDKVLSPQYVDWLVALVPGAGLAAAAGLVAVLALTRAEWDRFVTAHGAVEHWGDVLSWWVLARNLALVGLVALLLVRLRAAPRLRNHR
jgi:hypothetical protein